MKRLELYNWTTKAWITYGTERKTNSLAWTRDTMDHQRIPHQALYCQYREIPAYNKRGPDGRRSNWRSAINKDLQKMSLTWEEAQVAALSRQEWCQSVAQCIHSNAAWIKVKVKFKPVNFWGRLHITKSYVGRWGNIMKFINSIYLFSFIFLLCLFSPIFFITLEFYMIIFCLYSVLFHTSAGLYILHCTVLQVYTIILIITMGGRKMNKVHCISDDKRRKYCLYCSL